MIVNGKDTRNYPFLDSLNLSIGRIKQIFLNIGTLATTIEIWKWLESTRNPNKIRESFKQHRWILKRNYISGDGDYILIPISERFKL